MGLAVMGAGRGKGKDKKRRGTLIFPDLREAGMPCSLLPLSNWVGGHRTQDSGRRALGKLRPETWRDRPMFSAKGGWQCGSNNNAV